MRNARAMGWGRERVGVCQGLRGGAPATNRGWVRNGGQRTHRAGTRAPHPYLATGQQLAGRGCTWSKWVVRTRATRPLTVQMFSVRLGPGGGLCLWARRGIVGGGERTHAQHEPPSDLAARAVRRLSWLSPHEAHAHVTRTPPQAHILPPERYDTHHPSPDESVLVGHQLVLGLSVDEAIRTHLDL